MVKKRTQKKDTNVSVIGRGHRPLTKRLHEVKTLYNKGFNSSISLSKKMNLSQRSARRYLKRLKDSGLIKNYVSAYGVDPGHADTNFGNKSAKKAVKKLVNVHAQRWRVLVHSKGAKYRKNPRVLLSDFPDGLGGVVIVDTQDNYIFLRSKGQKFYEVDEEAALWLSLDFWIKILSRLENRLDIVIFKKGSVDMLQTYAEWETKDSVVCKEAADRGKLWRVFDDKDGKLRLSVDMSDGYCHEAHHQKKGMVDSENWNRHVNGVLNTDVDYARMVSLIEFLLKSQVNTSSQVETIATGLKFIVDLIKPSGNNDMEPVSNIDKNSKEYYYG